jgi:xanthine dehydrogenase FAD-binding subunit
LEYLFPKTTGEALELKKAAGASFIAGGTDLAILISGSSDVYLRLIDISKIGEITKISSGPEQLSIGAGVTIAEIRGSDQLPLCLSQGAAGIGSPQIRNIATIGGNICNASPCGDTLAPLVALKAQFRLVSGSLTRDVRAEDFFAGPKQTVKNDNEILTEILIDTDFLKGGSSFRMIGKRKGQAISQVNAAVWLVLGGDLRIKKVRAAVGSVAPTPLRLYRLEDFLKDKKPNEITLEDISPVIQEEIKPISDVRASQTYRKQVAATLVFDCLMEAAEEAIK